MTTAVGRRRLVWIAATVVLLAGLGWLDSNRAGPATERSLCNLALSRSTEPAADVLVVGSSRVGVAVDPVAMQNMMGAAGHDLTVERIALGRSPLRANLALLENYMSGRGAPQVIAFEISFLSGRSVRLIESLGAGSADQFLYRRDLNLLGYQQLANPAAVARPFSSTESALNRARFAAEGLLSRSGALVYQAASNPDSAVSLDDCDKARWTREPSGGDFVFSWDDAAEVAAPSERIAALRAQMATEAAERELKAWQREPVPNPVYRFDFDQPYRSGEMALLDRAVRLAAEGRAEMILLPLPLYGTSLDSAEMEQLDHRYDDRATIFDLYAATGVDLATYWYDDAHLEIEVAGELATAVLAQHLLDRYVEPRGQSR